VHQHYLLNFDTQITDVANQPVYENGNVNEATFAFTVQQGNTRFVLLTDLFNIKILFKEEEYAFCFTDRTNYYGENQPPRLVEIKMEHQKEKDYSDIAKKENLKPIEVELRKIEDAVEQLKGDFAYMKNREARHRNTNGTYSFLLINDLMNTFRIYKQQSDVDVTAFSGYSRWIGWFSDVLPQEVLQIEETHLNSIVASLTVSCVRVGSCWVLILRSIVDSECNFCLETSCKSLDRKGAIVSSKGTSLSLA
jgi:hypothetical protein